MESQKPTHGSSKISIGKPDKTKLIIAKKNSSVMKPIVGALKKKTGTSAFKPKLSKSAGVRSEKEKRSAGVVKQDTPSPHAISNPNSKKLLVIANVLFVAKELRNIPNPTLEQEHIKVMLQSATLQMHERNLTSLAQPS